jgi:hypothetical protein
MDVRHLEHTRAERMVVWDLEEEDIQTTRVVLAAHEIYAANMTDIDAMGVPGPDEHYRHTGDWRSNDGRTEPNQGCSTLLSLGV